MRVAVVGVGYMGTVHLETYAKMRDVELVGVSDVVHDVSAAASARFGCPAFSSVEELLNEAEPDAVSVCTSDEFHLAPTKALLEANVHVLLEKPIATTLADSLEIIRADDASKAKLLVGHILRFEARHRAVKAAAESGSIGDLATIWARRLNAASGQKRLAGRVSVLSFLGVHDFDLCNWIAGASPVRVYSDNHRGFLSSKGYDVEDGAFTTIRYDNGVIACVESGWILPDTHPRRGMFELLVTGAAGVIDLDLTSQGLSISDASGHTYPSFGFGIDEELAHFIRCAGGVEEPYVTAREGHTALEVSLAAAESGKSGQAVKLPLE